MRTQIFWILLLILAVSCRETEARWPVSTRSGSFLKESAERNRKLLEKEEQLMAQIIQSDSLAHYFQSASGSYYYYENKNEEVGYTPQPKDEVTLNYALFTWANDTLYRSEEIGTVNYIVDREALFPGLRNAVKLLEAGETAVFLFPSSLGYGYHGDDNRIGPNTPLKCRISLLSINKASDSLSTNP
jgi:gliding motility-associated peptidyl-prolyl isomerase